MKRMEVRRVVIVEVHRDHEPEKAADRRHLYIVAATPVVARTSGALDEQQ